MSDPLSVAASVAGLLTTAQMTSAAISKVLSTKKSGSSEINDVKSTVDTLRPIVQQLQVQLLNQAKIDPKRAAMIMFEEIASTLTNLVEVFSDLNKCIEGLEVDQKLGWLDSVRWLSKADELKGYLQRLEKSKTSLILMISILTNKSTFAAETAVQELRSLWVQGNEEILERMAKIERLMTRSVMVDGKDSASIISQENVRDVTIMASTNASVHPALGYTFNNDLESSPVYKRAKASRRFSIDSSTQMTQSWSILSGVRLSKISNINVQALPIFESDVHNSNLYSFGGTEFEDLPATTPSPDSRRHKRSESESWLSQIRSRLTQSGPKLTLTTQKGSIVQTIVLPKGLRLLGQNPTVGQKLLSKADISEPILLPSSAYEGILTENVSKSRSLELLAPPVVGNILPDTNNQPEVPQIWITSDTGVAGPGDTSDSQYSDLHLEPKPKENPTYPKAPSKIPRLKANVGKPRLLPDLELTKFHVSDLDFQRVFDDGRKHSSTGRQSSPDSFYRDSFSSAMPSDDAGTGNSEDHAPNCEVLYLAVSLFEFNIRRENKEAGYSYLTYQAASIFDVIIEKGELWLAKNHDDPTNHIGWIWSKHFVRVGRHDDEDQEKQDVTSRSRISRKMHTRSTSATSDSAFDYGFRCSDEGC